MRTPFFCSLPLLQIVFVWGHICVENHHLVPKERERERERLKLRTAAVAAAAAAKTFAPGERRGE